MGIKNNLQFVRKTLGENVLLYQFAQVIELDMVLAIQQIYQQFLQLDSEKYQILDIVPSYCDIALYLTPQSLLLFDDSILQDIIHKQNCKVHVSAKRVIHEIPVNYSGDDLAMVLEYYQINLAELIQLHSAPEYLIAMLGFRPYFPYLLGLDEKLFIPRRSSPRLNVKRGAIAIGGQQTGIYTQDSPGGWHIVGYTEFSDFARFKPGDYLKFKVV